MRSMSSTPKRRNEAFLLQFFLCCLGEMLCPLSCPIRWQRVRQVFPPFSSVFLAPYNSVDILPGRVFFLFLSPLVIWAPPLLLLSQFGPAVDPSPFPCFSGAVGPIVCRFRPAPAVEISSALLGECFFFRPCVSRYRSTLQGAGSLNLPLFSKFLVILYLFFACNF